MSTRAGSRHHPYRSSRRNSTRFSRPTGRRRPTSLTTPPASMQSDPGGCIDLTANDTMDGDVIDLTESTPGINRSAFDADPVVVISPTDVESADAHSRGNGRRLPVINWSDEEENAANIIDVEQEVVLPTAGSARVRAFRTNTAIAVDDSDDDLPALPFSVRSPNEETPTGNKSRIRCPICLDSEATIQRSQRQLYSTVCGHIFCSSCIRQAIEHQGACPSCRKKLTKKQIHQIFL